MTPQSRQGPLAVTSESSQRIAGEDALAMNLAAAGAVADVVRTTLGPDGMDKLLVDEEGDVTVTNDGATLIGELSVTHPAALTMTDVAATQEAQAGDGTTTAVVLAGELLAVAEDLLDAGLHPTTIVSGYRDAAGMAMETLLSMARPVRPDNVETLERVAATALTGTSVGGARADLASAVVEAVLTAVAETGRVDEDSVVVRSFSGGSLADARFIPGVLLDYLPCHPEMPTERGASAVLVYEGGIEVSETESDAAATVTDFEEYESFVERERAEVDDAVDRILATGADVVITGGGIDDRAQARFADAGVTAFYRIGDEHRERIAAATGGNCIGNLSRVSAADIGRVGELRQETIRELTFRYKARSEKTTVFADLPTGTVGTVFLRGGTEHAVTEAERAVGDAIDVVVRALQDGRVLPGAGAPEAEMADSVRGRAAGIDDRERHAVEAFADAMEVIPRTLAENAGQNVVDSLVALRSRHADGKRFAGIDPDGGVVDAVEAGVVEPMGVKTTAIATAVDAASAVLRIDDVISAGDLTASPSAEDED